MLNVITSPDVTWYTVLQTMVHITPGGSRQYKFWPLSFQKHACMHLPQTTNTSNRQYIYTMPNIHYRGTHTLSVSPYLLRSFSWVLFGKWMVGLCRRWTSSEYDSSERGEVESGMYVGKGGGEVWGFRHASVTLTYMFRLPGTFPCTYSTLNLWLMRYT